MYIGTFLFSLRTFGDKICEMKKYNIRKYSTVQIGSLLKVAAIQTKQSKLR